MKNSFLLILLLCGTLAAQSLQNVTVSTVPTPAGERFSFPVFGASDNDLFFTKDNFIGLWHSSLSNGDVRQLNTAQGAGYQPVISSDGSLVFYRSDEFVDMKRFTRVFSLNMNDNRVQELLPASRFVSELHGSDNSIVFTVDNTLRGISNDGAQLTEANLTAATYAHIDNGSISLHHQGSKRILRPLGEGNYIWVSVSPDQTSLLFTLAGRGTYITDLQGTVKAELGYANAPVWSPDGAYVAYMIDRDNGTDFTASELGLYSVATGTHTALTSTDNEIELYPAWSPSGKKIACATQSGALLIYSFEIE